jgi:hypothetical protein
MKRRCKQWTWKEVATLRKKQREREIDNAEHGQWCLVYDYAFNLHWELIDAESSRELRYLFNRLSDEQIDRLFEEKSK